MERKEAFKKSFSTIKKTICRKQSLEIFLAILTVLGRCGHQGVGSRADALLVVRLDDDLVGGELLERVESHLGRQLVRRVVVVDVVEAAGLSNFPRTTTAES